MTLVKNAALVSTAPQHEFFSYGAVGAFRFDFGHASSLAFRRDEIVAQSTRQIGAGRSATRRRASVMEPGSRVEPDCRAVRVLSRVDWVTPRLNRRDFPIIRAADRLPTTKLVRIRTESARNLNRTLQVSARWRQSGQTEFKSASTETLNCATLSRANSIRLMSF